MYEADPDPYCYPGTTVLKNKAELRVQTALEDFESAMTFARAEEALPHGRFSVRHYYTTHHHLFQDVYSWAGKPRTIRLAKEQSVFCYPENINREMKRIFSDLAGQRHLRNLTAAEFAARAAHFLAELNAVHPFREGNGRTQNTFLTLLAATAGHPIDLDRLDPEALLSAMIKSFKGNERPLGRIIRQLIA